MLELLNPFEWSTATYLIAIVVMLALYRMVPRGRAWYRRLLHETLLIAPAVVVYFAVRGVVAARDIDPYRNAEGIIRVQERFGLFVEPAAQSWVLRSDLLVTVMNWIYIWGHWPVVVGTLVWLIIAKPATFNIYRNAFLISGLTAMFIFAFFPVAPPRLVPELMVVDTITEQSRSYRALQPPALTNPYAAMPSLHFGWNLLMGIALVREARANFVRWLGYTIPVAMFAAIILTANHYWLDGLVGGTLVLASLGISIYLLKERGFLSNEQYDGEVAGCDVREHNDEFARPAHFFAAMPAPITIAHREVNSIVTLRAAEAAGVDVIECDLWLHRGRLEVRHSKTLGPIAKPRQVMVVSELPKTRSGKIMRRLLRDIAEDRELGDVTTLQDSAVMARIKQGLGVASSED
jgi:hypothetical protein